MLSVPAFRKAGGGATLLGPFSMVGLSTKLVSIPAGVKRLLAIYDSLVLPNSSVRFRAGTGGVPLATGYASIGMMAPGTGGSGSTVNFLANLSGGPANSTSGIMYLDLIDPATNSWLCSGSHARHETSPVGAAFGSRVSLSGVLDVLQFYGGTNADVACIGGSISVLIPEEPVLLPVQNLNGLSQVSFAVPANAKSVRLLLSAVNRVAGSYTAARIGSVGVPDSGNYLGTVTFFGAGGSTFSSTAWATSAYIQNAQDDLSGAMGIDLLDSATNEWTFSGSFGLHTGNSGTVTGGSKVLSGPLNVVQLLNVGGQLFTAGKAALSYST